jgi:hypothetical protein
VTEAHLEAMTDDAMKSGGIALNSRRPSRQEVLALYKQALG